jgi:hypothetical protein
VSFVHGFDVGAEKMGGAFVEPFVVQGEKASERRDVEARVERIRGRPRSRPRPVEMRTLQPEEIENDFGMIAWAILFALAAFFIVFSEAAKAG